MSAVRQSFVVLAVALGLALATVQAAAQSRGGDGPVVMLGEDYTVAAGERVEDVVVIGGSATIEGEVDGDAVAVMGDITLAGTARVEGDFVVVLGSATIEPGAVVERDLVVVASDLDAPPGFRAGGDQVVVVGGVGPGNRFGAVVPWFREGLLWGRPFVPSLPWMWGLAALFALLYLAVNFLFERPVRTCVDVLAEKPLSTGLGGVLVVLLIGPVFFILAVSVVGLVVIPFVVCALLLASLVGRVAAARWIGSRLIAEDSPENWRQGTRSLLIGMALVGVAYLVPVLGFVTWTTLGVFGLGAVAATVVAGLKKENPQQPAPTAGAPEAPADSGSPVDVPATAADAAPPETAAAVPPLPAAPSPASDAPPDLSVYPRAGFGSRLGALALDVLLLGITGALLHIEHGWMFLLIVVYHVGFWAWKSTTIGGIVCHLRVVRSDGTPLRFTEALVRGLSAIFSVAVAGLGWFWMLWDPDRQTWHDKIAGTIVVRVPTSVTLP